ncbi:MAG: hypothetical protein WAM65_06370 [Candidatus Korobacteraceae bacterium]
MMSSGCEYDRKFRNRQSQNGDIADPRLHRRKVECLSSMEKLHAAPSQQRPQVSAAAPRLIPWLKTYWDFLAVVLLGLASFPTVWLRQRAVFLVPNYGLIDDHWHLDSTFKLLRGIYIGRNVAFTHGPIFQWLSSIPARSMRLSFGALYATWNTVPLWCAIIFAYLALRLLLPEQPPWKRFVLLLLLSSFWGTSLRTTFPVLLFALYLRGWYRVKDDRVRSVFVGVGGAVLCGIAFLIAGDTGVYATAAWFICMAAIALETRREPFGGKLLSAMLGFVVAAVFVAIAANCFLASPLDFKFWRDSLAQVAVYRWATPAAMTDKGTALFFGGLLIGLAIFVVRFATRDKTAAAITERTAFLAGAFVFGLAQMQSALVRSDVGHVIIGEFAMIFFASVILFSFRGKLSAAGVFVAIACSMLFSHPVFRPSSVIRLYSQLRDSMTDCPPGYGEFDRACYREPLTPPMLNAAANFLSQHSGPSDSIFVFPYQTMFGLAARRDVAGGLMQAYTASGPYLSRLEISGLEGKSIPAALYLPDDDYSHMSEAEVARWSRNYLSVPVDGISNFTRIPEVWFWMVRHYRAAEQLTPGVVGLQRDDSRTSRIALQAQSLGLPARSYAIDERSSATALGSPNWPQGFDFIRLRITVHYPFWWKLRKPERLQLEITRANGTRDIQWFMAQPNVSTEVWFYPWSGPDLARYFEADESQWRLSSRSAITDLRILATPLDWVSQQPESIDIESADAVRLTLSPSPR